MADWKAPGVATVSPFIMTSEPEAVIDFAVAALGARLPDPPLKRADGSLWHAALAIDDGTVMIAGVADPGKTRPAFVHVYVPDADATFARAVACGATPMMEPADQFYGERAGGVTDPAGNIWWFATFREAIPFEEIQRRAERHDSAAATGK